MQHNNGKGKAKQHEVNKQTARRERYTTIQESRRSFGILCRYSLRDSYFLVQTIISFESTCRINNYQTQSEPTDINLEEPITAVESKPRIWRKPHKDFNKTSVRSSDWAEVAKDLNVENSIENVRHLKSLLWGDLIGKYRRRLHSLKNKKSGSAYDPRVDAAIFHGYLFCKREL